MRRNHPVVLQAERRVAGEFDLVSVPSAAIGRKFERLPNVRVHPHGICKELFDRPHARPFDGRWEVNCVFTGRTLLDRHVLTEASRMFPKWGFHVIGPFARLPRAANVIGLGEVDFERTLPYLAHADIGLDTLEPVEGGQCLADSLKIMQYTYCRLPIVAPEFLRSDRRHVFCYRPADRASLKEAFEAAQRARPAEHRPSSGAVVG